MINFPNRGCVKNDVKLHEIYHKLRALHEKGKRKMEEIKI